MERESTKPLHRERLLFVTGLPSKIHPQMIVRFFERIGHVRLFKLSKAGLGTLDLEVVYSHRDLRKGFCIIHAEDTVTYDAILGNQPLAFYGRSLSVMPFKEGSDQLSSREKTRESLVLVKRVPASIPEEVLKLFLCSSYGLVKKIYRLQAESPKKEIQKLRKRKNHCYSVEFQTIQSADLAAKVRFIYWDASKDPMLVEKYQKFSGSNQQIDLTKIVHQKCFEKKDFEDDLRGQINKGFFPKSKHIEKLPATVPSMDLHNFSHPSLAQKKEFEHELVNFRPTEKKYFMDRNYLYINEFSAMSEEVNFRLNFISRETLRRILL